LLENAVKFVYDGARLQGTQTPADMDMEDGDVIDSGALSR
jgi:hypothetical protein